MTTELGGVAGTQALIGFGANEVGLITGGIIDIEGSNSMAFSVPRDGTITDIAAYYSVAALVNLVGSTVTITAQLYSSPTPDDEFSPIPGATVTLAPPLTGIVSVGAVSSGITTGLSIPVTAGTRLMFVLSASVTDGVDIATILIGFVSGGVNIV